MLWQLSHFLLLLALVGGPVAMETPSVVISPLVAMADAPPITSLVAGGNGGQ